MNSQSPQTLASQPLEEGQYKVDLEIADRFDALATEILRIALLGIGAYGFLLSEIIFPTGNPALSIEEIKWPLGVGVAMLGISVGFALAHRYFSTLCIYQHVRLIRAIGSLDNALALQAKRRFQLHRRICGKCMLGAVICMSVGALSVALTFAAQLFRAT